jgi:hypothetical protein
MHSRPSEKLLFIRMSIQNKEMVGLALSRQDMSAFPCFTVFLGGKIYLSPMMSTSAARVLRLIVLFQPKLPTCCMLYIEMHNSKDFFITHVTWTENTILN